jgi:hypothetical protein
MHKRSQYESETHVLCVEFIVHYYNSRLRFEILTAVKMSMLVFWVATLCDFIGRY